MGLIYESLDKEIRELMLTEFNSDIEKGNIYLSKRFNDKGAGYFPTIMEMHILEGSDDSLSDDLKTNFCFKTHEERKTAKGITMAKVPENASQTFAEGEYNRFYIRALCVKAVETNQQLQVYRGRHSENPRTESEALIGSFVNPETLLADLRENIGLDTALGLPNGPNSGLTLKFI
jgi:hypothetical protein